LITVNVEAPHTRYMSDLVPAQIWLRTRIVLSRQQVSLNIPIAAKLHCVSKMHQI